MSAIFGEILTFQSPNQPTFNSRSSATNITPATKP